MAFARPVDLRVVDLLRQASLGNSEDQNTTMNDIRALQLKKEREENEAAKFIQVDRKNLEYIDNTEIFGTAPSSVIDAADAVIFAGMLEGKRNFHSNANVFINLHVNKNQRKLLWNIL